MADLPITDLLSTKIDVMGNKVLAIYGYNPPNYAVYRTAERVLVHFADAKVDADKQRTALAPLNPLRGAIVGLIDGWRCHPASDRRYRRAERFDRRVGDALVVALEGDVDGAKTLLQKIVQDITTIRVAWARFEYLLAAFFAGLIADFLLLIIAFTTTDPSVKHLWQAAAAGLVGSFFSIALAIHKRSLFTDLLCVTNIMDAMLRMVIGLIAAPLLVALVECKVISLSFGGTPADQSCLLPAIIGFVAGFAERLIPDFLTKVAARPPGEPVTTKTDEPSQPIGGADGTQVRPDATGATGPVPTPTRAGAGPTGALTP